MQRITGSPALRLLVSRQTAAWQLAIRSCAALLHTCSAARSVSLRVPRRSSIAVAPSCSSSSSPSPARCFSSSTPSDADLVQWQNFNNAGLKFLSEGTPDKASLLFMSAMREPAVARTVYQYLSLSNLGSAFRLMQKYGEARDVLLQAIQALKAYPEQIHAGMLANLHREAALCSEALGDMQEAEEGMKRSLQLYALYEANTQAQRQTAQGSSDTAAPTGAHRKHALEQAGTHFSLAMLLHKSGLAALNAHEEAEAAAGRPVAARTAASAPPRMQAAARHYADALRLMRSVHGSDVRSKGALLAAPVLASLGTLQSEMGEGSAAQATLLEALDIYQQHNDPRLIPLLEAYMALLQNDAPALQEVLQRAKEEEDKDKQGK